jgi:hypothetical protein
MKNEAALFTQFLLDVLDVCVYAAESIPRRGVYALGGEGVSAGSAV